MPTFPEQYPRGIDQLAAQILRIQQELEALKRLSFRVPVLDADPDPNDPTNMWLFDDGRLNLRGSDGTVHRYREWAKVPTRTSQAPVDEAQIWVRRDLSNRLEVRLADGTVEGYNSRSGTGSGTSSSDDGGTTTKPKQTQTQPKTFTKTYPSTWSQTYNKGGDSKRNSSKHLWYGKADSFNLFQLVQIGFDDAQIRSDLSGSVIRKVELFIHNEHAWYNSGVWITFKGHNNSGEPSTYSGQTGLTGFKRHFGKPEAKWVQIPDRFGRALRDNNIKGIAVNQPSGSLQYYGYMKSQASGANRPKLRITYTK